MYKPKLSNIIFNISNCEHWTLNLFSLQRVWWGMVQLHDDMMSGRGWLLLKADLFQISLPPHSAWPTVLSGPRTMKRFKICHGGLGDTTSAAPAKWNPSFLKVIRELKIRRTTTKISAGSAELSEAGTNDLTWAWSLVVTSYQWWKAASDLACDLWHELVCEDIGAHYSERDHPRVDSSQQIKLNIKAKLSGHFC